MAKNIKDFELSRGSFWVKSDTPTDWLDDDGNYYELWGGTVAIFGEGGEIVGAEIGK